MTRARRTLPALIALAGAAVLLSLLPAAPGSAQQQVEVRAFVSDREVYLGMGFIYQVQVIGGSRVGTVDVSGLEKEFDVRQIPQSWLRFQDNREWREREKEGTSFYFRLFALKTGTLTIPSVTVRVDRRTHSSPPITVEVELPPPSTEYRLELSLSRDRVYVGEPVELTAKWYYLQDARYYYVNIPVLRHPAFEPAESSGGSGGSRIYVRSAGGGQYLAGEPGTATKDGVTYRTATFTQVVIPRQGGKYEFLPGTVQVWWQVDQGSPGRRGYVTDREFESTVVGSNRLSVQVLPLPAQGRPAAFSGIVAPGLELSASAAPTVMNVGDPVSFSLTVSGPPTVKDAEIPHLGDVPELTRDFTVNSGPMNVQAEDGRKRFSHTIRVKREDVTEIPSLQVAYFNTTTGSYQTASSRPIPITVRPTRVVTSSDLEGGVLSGMSGTTVKDRAEGINFNYRGTARLLADRPAGLGALVSRPLLLALLAVPAGLFLAALAQALRGGQGGTPASGYSPVLRGQEGPVTRPDPEAHTAQGRTAPGTRVDPVTRAAQGIRPASPSFHRLVVRLKELRAGEPPALLDAWRAYLGARLELSPGRLVRQDVEQELRRRGADRELVREVAELLARCELLRYGGAAAGLDDDRRGEDAALPGKIARAARMIERSVP
jgi:hypothetical protein